MKFWKASTKALALLLILAIFFMVMPTQTFAQEVQERKATAEPENISGEEMEEPAGNIADTDEADDLDGTADADEADSPDGVDEADISEAVEPKGSDLLESKEDTGSKIVSEITERREKYVKHFIHEDKTYEAAIYPVAVHYKEDGKWKDIDNSLTETTDEEKQQVYGNQSNSFQVRFAKSIHSNKLVRVQKDGYEISWNMEAVSDSDSAAVVDSEENRKSLSRNMEKKTLPKLLSGITYSDILPGTDLKYEVRPEEIKENIIIREPGSITDYIFRIQAKKLTGKQEGNSVLFTDDKGELVFTLAAPYMYDAAGEYSEEIDVVLEDTEKGYQLTFKPDQEWLADPARVYPIVIDPILRTSPDINHIKDSYVSQNSPGVNYGDFTILKTGTGALSGVNETYIKFDPLPTINPSEMIAVRNTPDQNAIIQLAKENKRGLSVENAQTLLNWAKEYNLSNSRIDMGHPTRNGISQGPHAHFGPVNHIPIFPE